MNPESARLVVACGKHAATVPRTAHADRLATQAGSIPHLDCGIEAVHIKMDDRAPRLAGYHTSTVARSLLRFQRAIFGG